MQSTPLELRRVLEQPLVIDREHVIGVPEQVRRVGRHDVLDLVDDVVWRASTMRVAEHGVAAPGAGEWAAARRDQRDGTPTVVLAPDVDVLVLINRGAVWEG